MRRRKAIFIILATAITSLPSAIFAVVRSPISSAKSIFQQGPLVTAQVQFWNFVFTEVPESTTLIHDADASTIVIDLLDYKSLPQKHGVQRRLSRKERERFTAKYVQRYELGVRRFATMKDRARAMGQIEERLYNVYQKNPVALQRLMSGRVTLRTQAGLADEFDRATLRAQNYLPYMERIFIEQGIPVELTRLAFVESMFNLNARSKVGASGIWQFMPDTARQYMLVNRFVDERNSPLKASRAAAKLLASNFRALGNWPLAITAYNHGPGSLQRAVRTLGTRDFERIVQNYAEGSFGFASKNFYAEFLAANNVYKLKSKNQPSRATNPLGIVPMRMKRPTTLGQIIAQQALSPATLQRLNPCLSKAGLYEYRLRPLPYGFVLFVPSTQGAKLGAGTDRKTFLSDARL